MNAKLRLAILGCGAITRIEHLPAAIANPDVEVVALVDSDLERANTLKHRSGSSCQTFTDWKQVIGHADAILNALPNHLHAPITLEALQAGMHVLCEKPLAITSADASACAEAAEQRRLTLAIGMSRRFVASNPLLHLVLRQGMLGALQDYEWQCGDALDWKSASGFYFDRALAGGGVLMDIGVHLLDGLLDWFGPATVLDYQDDNWGSGIEANCLLALEHNGPHGRVRGHMRLSRTFPLKNRLLVRGSQANAEIPNHDLDTVIVHRRLGGEPVDENLRLPDFPQTGAFYRQLDNFVQSIRRSQTPLAGGRSGAGVLACIEQCYAQARRLAEPGFDVPALERVPA